MAVTLYTIPVLLHAGVLLPVMGDVEGTGLTVTVILELVELKPSLTTTVYTVVTAGVTVGEAAAEVNVPGEEDQL